MTWTDYHKDRLKLTADILFQERLISRLLDQMASDQEDGIKTWRNLIEPVVRSFLYSGWIAESTFLSSRQYGMEIRLHLPDPEWRLEVFSQHPDCCDLAQRCILAHRFDPEDFTKRKEVLCKDLLASVLKRLIENSSSTDQALVACLNFCKESA